LVVFNLINLKDFDEERPDQGRRELLWAPGLICNTRFTMSIDFRILNQIEARRRQLKVLKYFSNPCMSRRHSDVKFSSFKSSRASNIARRCAATGFTLSTLVDHRVLDIE